MLFSRNSGPVSWLVVFLGNPGVKFAASRHNIGWHVAEKLEKKLGVKIDRAKYKALTCDCTLGGERVLLMLPQTFMNLSGDSVREAQSFYKIPVERVIVVSDDMALPPGAIRVKRKGSAGGHNGLKDIIAKCGGDKFPRVKVGIGSPPHPDYDIIDWVLGVPRNEDAEKIGEAEARAADAIECIIAHGVDEAMNRYNCMN